MGPTGLLLVADGGNHAIRAVAADGAVSTLAGSGGAGYADGLGMAASFNGPEGLACCGADGRVFVADALNNRIRAVLPNGDTVTVAGSGVAGFSDGDGTTAELNTPRGVALGAGGVLYVADTGNNVLRTVSPGAR